MTSALIVGNPKLGSRTSHAGRKLVLGLTGREPDLVIELTDIAPALLGWGDPTVRSLVEQVGLADIAVFASPTFKATYTGLLKLFLDQFAGEVGLSGVAIPLMLGAAPTHALAPELLLRPVLSELGAAIPAPGLYLIDSAFEADGRLERYIERWADVIQATAAVVGDRP